MNETPMKTAKPANTPTKIYRKVNPHAIRTSLRLLIVGLVFLLLGGCVGVGVWFAGKETSIQIGSDSCKPSTKVGKLTDSLDIHRIPIGVSKAEFLNTWGAPDKVSRDGGDEQWFYPDELKWRGIMPFILFIPVPIFIPAGHHDTVIHFRGDNCLYSEYHETDVGFLGCGVFLGQPEASGGAQGFMCGSGYGKMKFIKLGDAPK